MVPASSGTTVFTYSRNAEPRMLFHILHISHPANLYSLFKSYFKYPMRDNFPESPN